MARFALIFAALSGLLAIAAGSGVAHSFPEGLDPKARAWFDTAIRYQMWHALALFGTALLMRLTEERADGPTRALTLSAAGFALGTVLFCGGLYLLALTGIRAFAMVMPLGGLSFIAGWAALAWFGLRSTRALTGR
ncbi:MAG: DUF423 domain-containing protein [Alphaproteobacteria bacterium]